jgi:hypothetical protein
MTNMSRLTDLSEDGGPDGRNVQIGLAGRMVKRAIWADSLNFCT